MILEIVFELVLMTFGLGAVALFVSSRLLRVRIPGRRLLALAGVIVFAAIAADILASALVERGFAKRLLEEAMQTTLLAIGLITVGQVRVARSIAIAVLTTVARVLLLIAIEAVWALIVFGSVTF
jgi:hypothetical protein